MEVIEMLQDYAYEHGIQIDNQSVAGKSAIALKYFDDSYIAIDYGRFKTLEEQATALAHEIGHIETESLIGVYEPFYPVSKKECRSWKWAIQKQLPIDSLHDTIEKDQGRLWEVAEDFGVTEEFIRRAIDYYKQRDETFLNDLFIETDSSMPSNYT